MRALVQRVSQAGVSVQGREVGAIQDGLLVLLAVHKDDGEAQVAWMANKLVNLRILADEQGKMNRGLLETGGKVLLVSQFTLYGACAKGRRPSYVDSAPPELAEPLYRAVGRAIDALGVPCEYGEFGAMMQVSLVNDGPVTLIIDTPTP